MHLGTWVSVGLGSVMGLILEGFSNLNNSVILQQWDRLRPLFADAEVMVLCSMHSTFLGCHFHLRVLKPKKKTSCKGNEALPWQPFCLIFGKCRCASWNNLLLVVFRATRVTVYSHIWSMVSEGNLNKWSATSNFSGS